MEPTFSVAASSSTITPKLQVQIDAAITALPPTHQAAPYKGEVVESKEAALLRL